MSFANNSLINVNLFLMLSHHKELFIKAEPFLYFIAIFQDKTHHDISSQTIVNK